MTTNPYLFSDTTLTDVTPVAGGGGITIMGRSVAFLLLRVTPSRQRGRLATAGSW
jgi:hypothetical protein